ncbi:DUF58 domain-containing protein [Paenibacillus sp. PAMC21692]|uniref:DUF58 domain-containing protein n=1 Tax=Paenibacillus sp. PAMC21692 TaxID=2762320 RepID=UPI00164E0B41|nr:DUF58 domain-containing protein [Paenibacillus sp. PAMC21692]QNK56649.1 DUF58 domain-containing protein [Paenibacillus sp. PAMC21692]
MMPGGASKQNPGEAGLDGRKRGTQRAKQDGRKRDKQRAEQDGRKSNAAGGWPEVDKPYYRTRRVAWCVIILALACCGGAAVIRGGALEWYAFAVLLGVALFSGVLPLAASRGLKIVRALPGEGKAAGEEAVISVEVERRWRFPFVWFAVEDDICNESLMSPSTMTYRNVGIPGSEVRSVVRYVLPLRNRGVYAFRNITVTVGDWLGLTAIRTTLIIRDELRVWPSLPEGAGLTMLPITGAIGDEPANDSEASAEWGSRIGDRDMSKRTVSGSGPDSRPYREGDSIRHLDYRAAARGRGLRVKSAMLEQYPSSTMYIDTLAESYGGQDARFESCLSWAAFEAKTLFDAGALVRIVTPGWTFEMDGTSANTNQLQELFGLLACLRAETEGSGRDWPGHASLPARGAVHVFSGNWKEAHRWLPLPAYSAEQAGRPALHLVMEGTDVTSEMQSSQRELEKLGVRVRWLPPAEAVAAWLKAGKGADRYALG